MPKNEGTTTELRLRGRITSWVATNDTVVIGQNEPTPTLKTFRQERGKWKLVSTQPVFITAKEASSMVLSISENTLIVATPDQAFGSAERSGAVRAFVRTENAWQPIQTLIRTPPARDAHFGTGLDFNGLTLVVSDHPTDGATVGRIEILSTDGGELPFVQRTEVFSSISDFAGKLKFVGPDIATNMNGAPIFGENVEEGGWSVRGRLPALGRLASDGNYVFVVTSEGLLHVQKRTDAGYYDVTTISVKECYDTLSRNPAVSYFDNTLVVTAGDPKLIIFRRQGPHGRWSCAGTGELPHVATGVSWHENWCFTVTDSGSDDRDSILCIVPREALLQRLGLQAQAAVVPDPPEILAPVGPIGTEDVSVFLTWSEVPGVKTYRVRATAPYLKGCRLNGRGHAGVAAMKRELDVAAELSCAEGICYYHLGRVHQETGPCPNNPRYVVKWEVSSVDENGEGRGYPVEFWRPTPRLAKRRTK